MGRYDMQYRSAHEFRQRYLIQTLKEILSRGL
jgi:hypothetical protein